MLGTRSLFKRLDESQKSDVKFANGTSVKIGGQGTVAVNTSIGKGHYIHDVQCVPSLAYNLFECWFIDGKWIFSPV